MRLFGLSCTLPGTVCRPASYRAPLDLAAADVVLWSPAGSVAEYEELFEKPGGSGLPPLLSLAGTEAFLADERRQRTALNGLLHDGGIVIVDLARPARVRIHTVEQIFEVDLAAGLPHPDACASGARRDVPPDCVIAAGEPFRSFAAATLGGHEEAHRVLRHPGNALVATSAGEVLGYYAGIGAGYLVALPIGTEGVAADRAQRVVEAVEALAGAAGRVRHGILPAWVDDVLPPEEAALRDAAAALSREMERLRIRRRGLDLEREALRQKRELVFARGRLLEDAVSDAFRTSGASVLQGRDGESDLIVERAGGLHVVAVHDRDADGLVRSILHIADVAGREAARAGRDARAVLIDASQQELAPADRTSPPFAEPALDAARTNGVTLLTTVELLAMARRAPELPGDPWGTWLDDGPRPARLPQVDWLR